MPSMQAINEFLKLPSIAIVGVSRSGKKFGNAILRELRENGYRLFPVHPSASLIDGIACYPSLNSLPEPVGGLVIVVPPKQTEIVLREAVAAGIHRVWMQQGASSANALKYCEENGITEIHGCCILMFLEKSHAFHRFHRWIWKALHRLST